MAEVHIKDMDEHEIDTILAEDIDFEGHLTFKKPLMIKGRFKGEIKSTSSLYIGEKALVEATTEAAVISSRGKHTGDIVAHSRVELFSTAEVDGDITTPDFVMESGCTFNGTCTMGGTRKKDSAQRPAGTQQSVAQQAHGGGPQPSGQQAPGPQQGGQQQGGQQPGSAQAQQGHGGQSGQQGHAGPQGQHPPVQHPQGQHGGQPSQPGQQAGQQPQRPAGGPGGTQK
jgi:cytoskeletal protein CcmA (bactofilin family)